MADQNVRAEPACGNKVGKCGCHVMDIGILVTYQTHATCFHCLGTTAIDIGEMVLVPPVDSLCAVMVFTDVLLLCVYCILSLTWVGLSWVWFVCVFVLCFLVVGLFFSTSARGDFVPNDLLRVTVWCAIVPGPSQLPPPPSAGQDSAYTTGDRNASTTTMSLHDAGPALPRRPDAAANSHSRSSSLDNQLIDLSDASQSLSLLSVFLGCMR